MLVSGHFYQQNAEFPLPETGGKWAEKPEEGIQEERGVPRCVEGRREGTLTQGQLTRAGMLFPKGKYRGCVRMREMADWAKRRPEDSR